MSPRSEAAGRCVFFLSAGEPSGDLHAANLALALRARHPGVELVGLGGERMAAAGVTLHYPLTDLAVMWFGRAMLHLPKFFQIARQADAYFRRHKPDAVVVTDYPGFHWALAKRAHRHGVPVYYFVPPQLWAWAGWRVEKMKKWVRTVMTALPFEENWYRERGVNTHHVGHPYFDELAEQKLDLAGSRAELPLAGKRLITLLPGSRTQEVTANWPAMLAAAKLVAAKVPDAAFAVAAFKASHAAWIRAHAPLDGLPITVHAGRTPELIERAHSCLAVSGSVGLELMTRLKPSVVVYRIAPLARAVSRQFITCPYISLVNLLAGAEVFPEFLATRDPSAALAERLIRWLSDPGEHAKVVAQLAELRAQVAVPGACERAAEFLLADVPRRAAQPPVRA